MNDIDELEARLVKEHEFLNSKESKEFTENFLQSLGKEMDEMFKGATFVMCLRYKTQKSFDGKLKKILARTDSSMKEIYDNIGLKIVVTHVSPDVIHANCQDIIVEREKRNNQRQEVTAYRDNTVHEINEFMKNQIQKLIIELKNDEDKYKDTEESEEIKKSSYYKCWFKKVNDSKDLQWTDKIQEYRKIIADLKNDIDIPDEENSLEVQIRKLQQEKQDIEIKYKLDLLEIQNKSIEAFTDLYNEADKRCNDLYATYILEQIKMNSKVLKKLGINSIPNRYKRHTGSKHYYVASHNSYIAGKKSVLPDWKIEIQATSDYYNQVAIYGKARHSEKDGKARILPNLPKTKEEYIQKIKPSVPEVLVYKSGSGKIGKCSEYENFFLYYNEVIGGDEYLKNLYTVLKPNLEKEKEKEIDK